MALRKNPQTGVMEDDGQPDPHAGTPGAVMPVPFFPAKPEHERTVTTERRTPGVLSQQAQGEVIGGQADVLNATNRETDAAAEEAGVRATGAVDAVTELERQKTADAAREAERQRVVAEHKAADDKEIEEARKAKVAAGSARADFWQGNASGEILAAILRGVDRAVSTMLGQSGPTGVDRIIEAKIADHERKMVGAWEATKEANDLKRTNRVAYQQELDRRRVQAANQSMLELKLVEARTDKALAALGPERAKAAGEAKTAAFQHGNALLEQKRAEGYDSVVRAAETNRSPTATAGSNANKPLSAETQSRLLGAGQYGTLADRNLQILEENGGQIPYKGPLATEYETNNKKMGTILQTPLGKSDSDAKTAHELQGAPGLKDRLSGKLGFTDPVANYKRSLEVNRRTLTDEANKAAAIEGKPVPAGATVSAAAPPVEEFTDKKTGQKFKGRRRPDGKIEAVD